MQILNLKVIAMSEKRFKFYSDDYLVGIIDTVTGKKLNHFATIDLLNEQQEMIDQLEKENTNLIELAEELGGKIEVVDDD